MSLKEKDEEIFLLMELEKKRQKEHIELIASENFVSLEVLSAQGSILTNKYAEGYPYKRYYGGCEVVDKIEELAIKRACQLFKARYANVQPHSGSQANMGAYGALLNPKDKILGMALSCGGHLTHGYDKSFSGKLYQAYFYGVNAEGFIDYDEVERLAVEIMPKLIIAGASAYPRIIDFKRFREIADRVGAYLLVDMAHIAGLVGAGVHPSPIPYADVVTLTTHKTLRGPRGGLILTNDEEIFKKINSYVFPGIQGGPLMHTICAKAVALKEALSKEFVAYCKQIISNSKTMAEEFIKRGYTLVSGGTDNHLILIDTYKSVGLTGKKAEEILGKVNITCNKNAIPKDNFKPSVTSGIRIGTPAITTLGFKEEDCMQVVDLIDRVFRNYKNETEMKNIKEAVLGLMRQKII